MPGAAKGYGRAFFDRPGQLIDARTETPAGISGTGRLIASVILPSR